jgi:DoxX-like protein
MTKRNKIIYWISTVWLALGMFSTGLVQLLHRKEDVDLMVDLGYPLYVLTLLGIWKLLGVVVLFIPRTPLLKEWTYAGFFFAMSGALFSHLASHNSLNEIAPPLLLLILTVISWYFRPAEKKLALITA